MVQGEIVSYGNLNEQNLDSEECLSESNKQLLSEKVFPFKHPHEQAFNQILLDDNHEDKDSEHVSVRERVFSLGDLITKFLVNCKHVDDNQSEEDLDNI